MNSRVRENVQGKQEGEDTEELALGEVPCRWDEGMTQPAGNR